MDRRLAIAQLGNYGMMRAMIGFTVLPSAANELTFGFKGWRKANRCTITLNGLDLYDMAFWRIDSKTLEQRIVATETMVYDDGLGPTFERVTGLYLHM